MAIFVVVVVVICSVFICVAMILRKRELKKEENEVIILDFRGEATKSKVFPAIEPNREGTALSNNHINNNLELETGRGESLELKARHNPNRPMLTIADSSENLPSHVLMKDTSKIDDD